MLGFLSDAHGNVAAFDRGLALLRRRGATDIYFLGDAVGYIPSISVLERLRDEDIPCVMGNHEAMLLSGDVAPEREAAYRLREIAAMLSPDWLDWIATWPRARRLQSTERDFLLVHGSPADPTFAYVYPDTDLAPFAEAQADAVFMGNTHRPFTRIQDGCLYVNIGSCGMPRDHGAWGSVCLFDPNSTQAHILRYAILDTIDDLVSRHPDLHAAALNVFARRPDGEPYGEICS